MDRSLLSQLLRSYRQASGLTQKQVASMVSVSPKMVSHWETGYAQPDVDSLGALLRVYGVDANQFFGHFHADINLADRMSQTLTPQERALLQKYRDLGADGRAVVDYILDREHSRLASSAAVVEDPDSSSNVVKLSGIFPHLGLASAGTGAMAQDAPIDWETRADAPKGATATLIIKGDSMEPLYHDGDVVWIDTTRPAEDGELGVFVVDGQTYCKRLRLTAGGAQLESLNPKYEPIPVTHDDARQLGRVVQK